MPIEKTARRTLRAGGMLLLAISSYAHTSSASESADDGYALYQQFCSVCHGDNGDGQSRARQGLNPPPKDFTEPGIAASLSRELMLAVVSEGKPGTAMTGWKSRLNETQIVAVVDFISQQFMRVNTPDEMAAFSHGRTVYMQNCAVCHGDDGGSARWTSLGLNPPPKNFTDPAIRQSLSRGKMISAVAHGKPDTAMVGFSRQLRNEDIKSVVDYIRTAFMKMPADDIASSDSESDSEGHAHGHDDDHGSGDLLAAMPEGLAGDEVWGEDFYRDNCATCHGIDGLGDGPRAYFINPKPTNFTEPGHRAHLDRVALYEAIKDGVRGKEMPAWGKVLTNQQIANVTEYVFNAFIISGENMPAGQIESEQAHDHGSHTHD